MWFRKSKPWHLDTDVVVVGTGAAGATAALAAHAGKARVVVLDKSEKFGGTTAVSGGVVWVPNTRHMAEVVTANGGSLSGEHGDGRARGELLSVMFGDELAGGTDVEVEHGMCLALGHAECRFVITWK